MPLPGTNPAYQYVDEGMPDGSILGQNASALVAFWGATPVSQRGGTVQNSVATTAAVSFAGTPFGFGTTTQFNSLITLVNEMRTVLVNAGIMKGGV